MNVENALIVLRNLWRRYTAERDPWVKWKGGEQPIPGNPVIRVRVRFRDGTLNSMPRSASIYRWQHLGGADDIVAYRITEPPKSA